MPKKSQEPPTAKRRRQIEAEMTRLSLPKNLKKRKDFMRAGDYDKRRDEIVIEIARVSRRIRTEQAGRS